MHHLLKSQWLASQGLFMPYVVFIAAPPVFDMLCNQKVHACCHTA